MSTPRLPERLRQEVLTDLQPVRPLPRPALRAMEIAIWALALFLLVPRLHPLREDAAALGPWLLWGVAIGEAVAGLLLAGLALREAVPGGGLARARVGLALALGATTQLAASLLTWTLAPATTSAEMARHRGAVCFSIQELLAIPGLALAFWLVQRALPVRPRWSGALAGLAAGLLADAAWHLICPRSDLPHVLIWHGGATLLTTTLGWLLGTLYEVRAVRRLAAAITATERLSA
ncbi:MAG TPA: NrsF family protein [Vicinamibacteria bacterium]|nr:NrsF family protein [Vicinamibacteria bacterium]